MAIDGVDDEVVGGFSVASAVRRWEDGARLGMREAEGDESEPRLTRVKASIRSSSVCSSKGSRFIRTVPEKSTASGHISLSVSYRCKS